MSNEDMLNSVKAFWNETSDSEWYRSLRTDEKIRRLKEKPESAFHPAVYELLCKYLPDLHWRIQDIINSQIGAGLRICELAELPAIDASFWFSYAELQEKRPEELEGINDWKKNPMAALPAWAALVSEKK